MCVTTLLEYDQCCSALNSEEPRLPPTYGMLVEQAVLLLVFLVANSICTSKIFSHLY